MNKIINIRLRYLLIAIAAGYLILLAGYYIGQNLREPQPAPNEEKRQGGYKYISPLLECDSFQPASLAYGEMSRNLQKLVDTDIASQKIKNASIYFRDLNNGPWFGINEKEKFSPASLLKVPLLIAYLKLAETDPASLNKKLTVHDYKETVLSQNISPLAQVTVGKEYTVENLLEYMIKYSDNVAADTLLENMPPQDLENIYTDLNMQIPGTLGMENFMTVIDYASFFRILYNASYLDRAMSEKALQMLTVSDFTKGLAAGLPGSIEVAHKFGERKIGDEKQLHDCGIVYLKNNNYLLCVMTRGDDFSSMEQVIADISRQVYSDINKFTNK